MARSVSLVVARKDLGRIVEEVGRTGSAVKLTRRGQVVARIVPEGRNRGGSGDPLASLGGTVELRGSFADLAGEIRALRKESGAMLGRRASRLRAPAAKRRG